jgi:peroxiredoxin
LVVITPQLEQFSKDMRQKLKLGFDILSDRGNQTASQFGLTFALPEDLRGVYGKFGIDLPRSNGDDSWALPMPARFIIDRQGTVRSTAADPDYTIRPEPEETVELLGKLASLPASA